MLAYRGAYGSMSGTLAGSIAEAKSLAGLTWAAHPWARGVLEFCQES